MLQNKAPPHQQAAGGTSSWEGGQPGQPSPTDQEGISDHMMPCSARKSEEE